jgi:hypothetical protein
MFNTLNQIDWDLLHEQKLTLLQLLERQPYDSPYAETLSGIVNLLDALQDEAAEAGIWSFPGETEEAPDQPPSSKRYYVEDDDGHHHGPLNDYEEAAMVAEAVHGRIIVQDANQPSAAPKQDGQEVPNGQA